MEIIGSRTDRIAVLFDEKTKKYVLVDTFTDQEISINEDFLIQLGGKARQKKMGPKSFINVRPDLSSSSVYDTIISDSIGKISLDDSFINSTIDFSKEFAPDHDFILKGDWLKGE